MRYSVSRYETMDINAFSLKSSPIQDYSWCWWWVHGDDDDDDDDDDDGGGDGDGGGLQLYCMSSRMRILKMWNWQ